MKDQNKLPVIKLISYAQNAEDVVLCRAFGDLTSGFYVDLGAGHPKEGSLTWNLVHKLRWRGIDVEPNRELCLLLKKDRPQNKVLNIAVYDRDGEVFFEQNSKNWAMSKIFNLKPKNKKGFIVNKIETQKLDTILKNNDVDAEFDLLKIDIEGAEEKVLKNFDFSFWRPKVILIEVVKPDIFSIRHSLRKQIESQGYIHCLYDGINSFFVYKKYKNLIEQISKPACVHDKYISFFWWKFLPLKIRKKYSNL